MSISTHLMFAGNCGEALRFYAALFGGDLKTFSYGASPMAGSVPSDWGDKLLHAVLTIGEDTIMGADLPADQFQKPQGFYMVYAPSLKTDAERAFAALADGGSVQMPLQQTFWSPAFAVLTDRFGVPWEINCEEAASSVV